MESKILPLWQGGRAYVIGGGPSLRGFDTTLLDGKHIVAVNNAYRLFPKAEALYFMDTVWYNWHAVELMEFKGLMYTTARQLKDKHRVKFLNHGQRKGIDDRPDHLSKGTSSGYGGIGVAIAYGVKEVIILGFDMCRDEDGNHNYHNDHRRPVKDTIYEDAHMLSFPALVPACKERGITIINCNLDSALECFPKEELGKWLQ